MSSVTKNPQILVSASYVYNWFLSLGKENEKFLENNELLNHIKSDELITSNLEKNHLFEQDRIDIDKRFERLLNKIVKE